MKEPTATERKVMFEKLDTKAVQDITLVDIEEKLTLLEELKSKRKFYEKNLDEGNIESCAIDLKDIDDQINRIEWVLSNSTRYLKRSFGS